MSFASFFPRRVVNVRVLWVARLAIAVVYIWFGVLKLLALSPASPMVSALAEVMFLPKGVDWTLVMGGAEVLLGLLFLFPRYTALAFWAMVGHLFFTALPLVFLPTMVWSGWFVPTLEGQYILKNVLLFSLGYVLFEMRKRR
jgi:uncharacterized membrane protein YkgB